ncbi:MAG: hypothetical protein J6J60_04155 [Clostridia bacterium]|mgnify:CR=1 FL=1|nr:hypothetical protein [Clostridia bacterium]MBP3596576.1 hypothetical protein [Clostridia bacterium]
MEEELYTYSQVKSFALIALHNLLNSGNNDNINLRTFQMFLDPLDRVHKKENVIDFAEKLLESEKN